MKDNYKVSFFAGAETGDNKFNRFTGSFIKLMTSIFGDDFKFIKGVYYRKPMFNVIWALNNSQKPIGNPVKCNIVNSAFRQIIGNGLRPDAHLIIISSSSGSVVAAQAACYLAEENSKNRYLNKPFDLVLGASMIATGSPLFKRLLKYQEEGYIRTIIHDIIQDEGDNSVGIGGLSRSEAYKNAFGIMIPLLSARYSGPSFLNKHPDHGHIHRRRSMTVQKAIDYINIILIKKELAGEIYKEKASRILIEENI